MDSLAHFMLALLAGLAVGLHKRHKVSYIALIALAAVFIDLDHFLVLLGYGTNYRSMHNIFVAILTPAMLFFISWYYERGTGKDTFRTFFLLLTIMLAGHLIADMVGAPGVKLFYPYSEKTYFLPDYVLALPNGWEVIGRDGVYMTIYVVIIFMGAVIHDALYYHEHKMLNGKDAIKKTVRDYF